MDTTPLYKLSRAERTTVAVALSGCVLFLAVHTGSGVLNQYRALRSMEGSGRFESIDQINTDAQQRVDELARQTAEIRTRISLLKEAKATKAQQAAEQSVPAPIVASPAPSVVEPERVPARKQVQPTREPKPAMVKPRGAKTAEDVL